MLWEIYQQNKISGAEQSAERAERKVARTTDEITQLRRHVDRLTLACQSMWELVRDNSPLSDEDLDKKMLEVDMCDGKADGKIGMQAASCGNCGSATNSKRAICVMCGAPLPKKHHFDG